MQRLEVLKDFIQEAVDRGATSVEQIHQHIAALPFEALEKSGLLENDRLNLREKQAHTIGMVYDAIRRINREVGQLISDQFENVENTGQVSQVLNEQDAPVQAAARKSAPKKRRATNPKA